MPKNKFGDDGLLYNDGDGNDGFLCLVIRKSERSGHRQRLLQAFTEDVFIFSLLVYIAYQSFLDDELCKFTYSLTYNYFLLAG